MPIEIGLVLQIIVYGYITWIILNMVHILIRCLRDQPSKKEDSTAVPYCSTTEEPLNIVIMVLLLIVTMAVIGVKVGFELKGRWQDVPAIIIAAVPVALLSIMLVWNLLLYALGIRKKSRWGIKNEDYEISLARTPRLDRDRKISHVVILGIFMAILLIGEDQLQKYYIINSDPNIAALLANYWGNTNGLNYMSNIFVRNTPPFGQSILILWLIGQTFVLLTVEITRLSERVHFPFQRVVQTTLRYKELDTFGAYTHFDVGYLMAIVILPPTLFIATMCLLAFADPTASILGIRLGKHRYSWNQKSLEGTIAGGIMAFATMFVFVGPLYSLIGAIGFVIVDIVTPKPIGVSDNLAMPIVNVLLFGILSLLQIPCVNYLGI